MYKSNRQDKYSNEAPVTAVSFNGHRFPPNLFGEFVLSFRGWIVLYQLSFFAVIS